MNTRKIAYIEPEENQIDLEVAWALSNTPEERFRVFMQHQRMIFALAGIDIMNLPVKKNIYFIEDE